MCSGSGFSLIGVGDEEMILAKDYSALTAIISSKDWELCLYVPHANQGTSSV
jgi:hypothetical protein